MVLLLDEPGLAHRDLGVIRVAGPDRLTYLHSLLSQPLDNAGPGQVSDFLYLDAKGNPLAVGRLVVSATEVLLLTPREVTASFTEALQRYTFLLDAQTTDLSQEWAVASIRGPEVVDYPRAPQQAGRAVPAGDGFYLRDPGGGVDLVGPRPWISAQVEDVGLAVATSEEWEAARICAGEPAWGSEIVPGRRAQELGLLPTHVHLRKGCYPGQESIAKIFNLGRPRRALAVVEFAGQVTAGDPVAVGTKSGEITSSAPAGAVWVAMALLPVDAGGQVVGDGTVVVGDVRGRVRKLVGEGVPIPGAWVPA